MIVYNELVANAVALQNVVDQTQASSVRSQVEAKLVLTIYEPITHSGFVFKHATVTKRGQSCVIERA